MLKAFFFVLNECFFSSFDINDMHVQTIFIEDLEKPLAELLLWVVHKNVTVYAQFADLS